MPSNANFLARLETKMRAAHAAPVFETADGGIITYAQLLDGMGGPTTADYAMPGKKPPSESEIIKLLGKRLAEF